MVSSQPRFVPLLLAALLWLGAAVPAHAFADGEAAATPVAEAALERFNREMRGLYGEARAQMLAATGPVIVVGFETVTLLHDGERHERRYTPAIYHRLKAVVHVILGVAGATLPALEGAAEADWRTGLVRVRDEVDALAPHIGDLGFSPAQAERQRRLLEATRSFLDEALAGDTLTRGQVAGFLRDTKPLWLANVREAAAAQLDRLHGVVSDWQAAMAPADWETLYVLILGPRMPREQNLQTAYFLRRLGAWREGERIVYAENVFDIDGARNLLGVMVIDRELSRLVFGDPYRMDADALGHAAQDVLDGLLP
ncbi:MAG: hypothetical protein GVY13_19310 [Alphaproteobacteria bacterium]|jgi:hypothetical protein|nr:hypothetical protein [Alphaproteobacteria bacterium]